MSFVPMKLTVVAVLAIVAVAAPLKANVGQQTYGLASSGGSLWVGGVSKGDVLRVNPATGKVVSTVKIGPRIFNLAVAPGAIWAVGNLFSTVSRIDTRTGKVTATVQVGSAPYDVEWGFGSAWVSNSSSGTVSRITGKKVVATIKVGVEPNGLAAIGGALWVTDHTAGKLIRIDPATNEVTGTLDLPGADWVTGLDGSLYVSQETNVVTRVDAATMKVLGVAKVKRNPLGSAIVRGQLWVPCIDANSIVVVDPKTMNVVRSFPGGPGPIVVQPVGKHVWISHTTGSSIWRL